MGPAGQLRRVAPLTYPHLESLGLEETVSGGEDVELVQDGASTKAFVVLLDEQSLQQECQSQTGWSDFLRGICNL